MKAFNTTAVCIPEKHYMVDLSERVKEIKKLVDDGKYFTINRARQYGKTTTIDALCKTLRAEYEVVSLSFEGIGDAGFKTEQSFVKAFARKLKKEFRNGLAVPEDIKNQILEFIARKEEKAELDELFDLLQDWCYEVDRDIVLIIDEVDSATNNQVFLDFLAGLRDSYINRDTKGVKAFQSVILAGVTDVKHLRSKIRDDEQHRVNSPWNIAADFDIDMSLSEEGIREMLDEYEADHQTGMDTAVIAKQIREYTSGYPFLVSRICQLMDTEVTKKLGQAEAWTQTGFDEAIKSILAEKNTLFDSLTGKLVNYPEFRKALYSILIEGVKISYNPDQKEIVELQMYGLIRNEQNIVRVANRIFETRLYNLFLSDEELRNNVFGQQGDLGRSMFIKDGRLDMPLIMDRFIKTYTEIYGPLTDKFHEKDGRELFLLYLKPIINGTGNYYVEAQTRDQRRMDIVVDYLGKQYIIELKIWHGERYNADGEQQIGEYMDYFGLTTGYMLSFNFNKNKEPGVHEVRIGDKLIYEGIV